MLILRSTLFNICYAFITFSVSILLLVARPFGFRAAWFFAQLWTRSILFFARIFCGIKIEIEGREHIPDTACVLMAKHQSAFETIAMPILIPPYVWILKRELFYIPLFGWALWALNAIAIRRGNPREALKQVIEQGKCFLSKNRWVAIFPEGTRSSFGSSGNYKPGGVVLAQKANAAILPMAHNAGLYWPKNSYIKKPGTIRVRFLPIIPAATVTSMKRKELLDMLEDQIETACKDINKTASE